jgi:uncharacterized protein YneF (UPF0154 family)
MALLRVSIAFLAGAALGVTLSRKHFEDKLKELTRRMGAQQ